MVTILLVHAAIAVIALTLLGWHAVRERRREQRLARALQQRAGEEDAPPTLHPVIDPAVCMGSGACVRACPEKRPLVLVGGRSHLAEPSACIGHGACRAACPVGAISLVFGTERRGVELPELDERFQTSQPGVYIAGELGGMGLVANAARQGVEATEAIAASLGARADGGGRPTDVVALVIAGAGPAGIAAALEAKRRGIEARILERERSIGGSVRTFHRQKIVMTTPVHLPLYGMVRLRRTHRDTLIELWNDVIARAGIGIEFGVSVEGVRREGEHLVVATSQGPIRAERVLLATGRRGQPRRLGVPGEDLPHVLRVLEEPERHDGAAVLVVGGGDSAIEAALALAERPGTRVALSHRSERFSRAKPANGERIAEAAKAGRVRLLLGSRLVEIRPGEAMVEPASGAAPEVVPADVVLALIGAELPVGLLAACGVEVRTYRGDEAGVAPAVPGPAPWPA